MKKIFLTFLLLPSLAIASNVSRPGGGSSSLTLDQVFANGSTLSGGQSISLTDNVATAFEIKEASNSYLKFTTTNSSELITFSENLSIQAAVTMNGAITFTAASGLSRIMIPTGISPVAFYLLDNNVSYLKINSTASAQTVTTEAGWIWSTQSGVTAFAGGGQASATSIGAAADLILVATVATAGDSVKLPVAVAGRRIIVRNGGANSIDIFPATGGAIDALATNAAYALAAGGVREFIGLSSTAWFSR